MATAAPTTLALAATEALEQVEHALLPFHFPTQSHNLNSLRRSFIKNFHDLAKNSTDQFLPTPIINLPNGKEKGRFLAMDFGGTNLRIGVVELFGVCLEGEGEVGETEEQTGNVNCLSLAMREDEHLSTLSLSNSSMLPIDVRKTTHEAAMGRGTKTKNNPCTSNRKVKINHLLNWEIPRELKSGRAETLFMWVAERIADVIKLYLGELDRKGQERFLEREGIEKNGLKMAVVFSFPMVQDTHDSALLLPMGKGFTFSTTNNLSTLLSSAYSFHRSASLAALPILHISAITNDSISTLLSECYLHDGKAAVGVIAGTGINATCLCPFEKLGEFKQRKFAHNPDRGKPEKVLLNTEWSINGTLSVIEPYRTKWDLILDEENEKPGFQPLEEMTGGRYLGELVRLVSVDLLVLLSRNAHSRSDLKSNHILPIKFHQPYAIETKFCSDIEAFDPAADLKKISEACGQYFSLSEGSKWTDDHSLALHRIISAISTRATALVASATVALLSVNDDLGLKTPKTTSEIVVSYTGTMLEKYPKFRERTQEYIDRAVELWYDDVGEELTVNMELDNSKNMGDSRRMKVRLAEARDGGLIGAAVLAGMVESGRT